MFLSQRLLFRNLSYLPKFNLCGSSNQNNELIRTHILIYHFLFLPCVLTFLFVILIMIALFFYILEVKKELLVGLSLSVLYITYYLMDAVKKPQLVCRPGAFRHLLEHEVPLLQERYWPTPWCVEARLQTVLGSLLRSLLLPRARYRREVLRLADGGQLALDWAEPGGPPGSPVLLVLPGLTGGSHADYVRCLVAAAAALGARAVVMHNRGLGGLPLTSPRLYCAVSHSDLAEVIAALRRRPDAGPLLAAGVSLGGLILGQYLAACGKDAALAAALAVSIPLDVPAAADSIERASNALLSYHMTRNLRNTVRAHDLPEWPAVRHSRSVREFDAAFTAKHFGFGSVDAYYLAATLRDKLQRVRVPLLCLCAADDPLQPAEALPAAEAEASPSVALAVTARGGHIGFLEGWWPAGAPHTQYISRLAQQYFGALLASPGMLHGAPPLDADR